MISSIAPSRHSVRLSAFSLDGEIEVLGGEGLCGQGEVPPLISVVDEPLLTHQSQQQLPVLLLDTATLHVDGVSKSIQAVEAGTHVDGVIFEPMVNIGEARHQRLSG